MPEVPNKEGDVVGACTSGERVIPRRRKVERDVAGGICVPSVSDVDHAYPPRACNLANGRVEPRIDDDGLDTTGVEMAPELVCRVLVADRNGDRALHDAENGCQRLRAAAMDDREATVRAETRMLKLGGYAIRQKCELAIAHVLPVPGGDRRSGGRGAAPGVDNLADRGCDSDTLRCGTQSYVGHFATMTGPVPSIAYVRHLNYIGLAPRVYRRTPLIRFTAQKPPLPRPST